MNGKSSFEPAEKLILASKSAARASVLNGAGLRFEQRVAGVDEETIKASMRATGAPVMVQAERLAETKALKVSSTQTGIVLGCDQMLDIDGDALDKPSSLAEARNHLKTLRGRTHTLETAIVACIDGAPVWRHIARPRLTMRGFSDAFLEDYLAQAGTSVLSSVGAYAIEGRGAQLFEAIEGDLFSIMGLPLLPLLAWLRDRGAILS